MTMMVAVVYYRTRVIYTWTGSWRRQENSDCSSPEWLEKASWATPLLLALDKPLWGLLAASGATHWWCMPNNDDGDDDVIYTVSQKMCKIIFLSLCQMSAFNTVAR